MGIEDTDDASLEHLKAVYKSEVITGRRDGLNGIAIKFHYLRPVLIRMSDARKLKRWLNRLDLEDERG